jgi:subtilase family serine protease
MFACEKELSMGTVKKIFQISVIASLVLSYSAYADPNDQTRARAPYRIKPNTPTIAPSGLSPATVQSIYGFNQIPNQGEGRTIAIVDAYDHPNAEQDLAVFNSTFNLPPCTTANGCFKKVYASGTKPAGDAGWGIEIALDIQWAHAIAPKAKIILVETDDNYLNNLYQGVKVALQYNPDVISMSWGSLESSSVQSSYESIFNVSGVDTACGFLQVFPVLLA